MNDGSVNSEKLACAINETLTARIFWHVQNKAGGARTVGAIVSSY